MSFLSPSESSSSSGEFREDVLALLVLSEESLPEPDLSSLSALRLPASLVGLAWKLMPRPPLPLLLRRFFLPVSGSAEFPAPRPPRLAARPLGVLPELSSSEVGESEYLKMEKGNIVSQES